MNKIIRNTIVVLAILSTVREIIAITCDGLIPMPLDRVCGSDGKTYMSKYRLQQAIECLKEKNNVTSVDLYLMHNRRCFIWEKYGIGTTSFILITLGSIIFGVCLCKFYRAIRNTWRKEKLFLTAMA